MVLKIEKGKDLNAPKKRQIKKKAAVVEPNKNIDCAIDAANQGVQVVPKSDDTEEVKFVNILTFIGMITTLYFFLHLFSSPKLRFAKRTGN